MTLLEKLGSILDEQEKEEVKENEGGSTMTDEVFENLLEKKLSDMELRLTASFEKRIKELKHNEAEAEATSTDGEEASDKE